MNKLSFSQKNDLVVKHKAKEHFSKDLELFQKHFPSNRLMNDLARANPFTFEKLDGQMLYLLLDKVSEDEILLNRGEKEEQIPPVPPVEDPSAPDDDEKMNDLEEQIQAILDDKDASIEELQTKIEGLEKKAVKKKE